MITLYWSSLDGDVSPLTGVQRPYGRVDVHGKVTGKVPITLSDVKEMMTKMVYLAGEDPSEMYWDGEFLTAPSGESVGMIVLL